MSKILFQQLCGGLGGGGGSGMDAGVLRVCINEDQPVGPQEVDGMVNMHCAPWPLFQGWLAGLGGLFRCSAQAVHQWQRSTMSASCASLGDPISQETVGAWK